MIAAAASVCGGRRMKSTVRNGRYLAVAAGATGPLFLVAHLKTPDRWYNMLRIIRPTSAMSLGSWILSGFGLFSGITAAASFLGDRRRSRALARVGDAAQWPAAILGAGMTTYTASLLSSTSTPRWASAPRALAVQFGGSAMAGGAAALSLLERANGRAENCRRLDTLAVVATAVEAIAGAEVNRRHRAATAPDSGALPREPTARALAQGVPLACYAVNLLRREPSPALSVVAALSILAGSAITRNTELQAGRASAQDADEYFRFGRCGNRTDVPDDPSR